MSGDEDWADAVADALWEDIQRHRLTMSPQAAIAKALREAVQNMPCESDALD